MRRRANEAHSRCRVTNAGNVVVYLAARQFAAFAWLSALRDLDLQFVGVGEIPRRNAEATRGNLLNGRALGVAVF